MDPTKFGRPVVTSLNIFSVLSELGVKPWPHLKPKKDFADYVAGDLTEAEKKDLRFAPKTEVVFLEQPTGEPYTGFRSVGKDWTCTFALLPEDLIPIVGEFKHGAEVVTLVPPCGVNSKVDFTTEDPMRNCARREFEEETGMALSNVIALSRVGLPISSRQNTSRHYPYLGIVKEPIAVGPSKLDKEEHLKMVLVPLREWLDLIETGQVLDDCAVAATHLALLRMGRLQLI